MRMYLAALFLLSTSASAQTSDAVEKAWMDRCVDESKMAMETGMTYCSCIWNEIGHDKLIPFKMLPAKDPASLKACEGKSAAGKKAAWIKSCLEGSNMAAKAAAKYCACVWGKVGPENTIPFAMLPEMDPESLNACKK